MEKRCIVCSSIVPKDSKHDVICSDKCYKEKAEIFKDMRIFKKSTTKFGAYGIGYDRGYQQAIHDMQDGILYDD